jgi:hypothetical protein
MPYGTVLADTIGTSVSGASLGAGNASTMKNRIINGAMLIDQRNAGASVTATTTAARTYVLDRWNYQTSTASKYSLQLSSTAPAGFVNSLKVTSLAATSLGSTDYYVIGQPIEGYNMADLNWGSANAKTVTLSFWVQSSLTGTFGGSIESSDVGRSYPFTYTISAANTWEQKSITIAGDTSGTYYTTNGAGAYLWFGMGVGSSLSGTAGSWQSINVLSATGATSLVGTNGATLYITGVQLEVGSSATGFEYRQYGQELALCQRYYETSFNPGIAPANNVSNFWWTATMIATNAPYTNAVPFQVQKRANPTLTPYAPTNLGGSYSAGQGQIFASGAWQNVTATNMQVRGNGLQWAFSATGSATQAYLCDICWAASAEL